MHWQNIWLLRAPLSGDWFNTVSISKGHFGRSLDIRIRRVSFVHRQLQWNFYFHNEIFLWKSYQYEEGILSSGWGESHLHKDSYNGIFTFTMRFSHNSYFSVRKEPCQLMMIISFAYRKLWWDSYFHNAIVLKRSCLCKEVQKWS